jgi:hypothetical protein
MPRAFDEGVEISRFKRRLDGPRITELSPGIATNGGRGIGTASSGSGPTFMFGQGVQGERAFLNNCRGQHLGAPFLGGSFVKTPRIWVRSAQQRVHASENSRNVWNPLEWNTENGAARVCSVQMKSRADAPMLLFHFHLLTASGHSMMRTNSTELAASVMGASNLTT